LRDKKPRKQDGDRADWGVCQVIVLNP